MTAHYVKKIKELELELALSKERLMIGSQIIRSIVTDTKDSIKYVLQSFDLITESTGIIIKGNKVKSLSRKDQN